MTGALAIVPARGGSRGIPGKNLRPVAGRPLLAWTLETARAATDVGRVVVTTDDDAIAEAARAGGAEVVARPPELATDEASSESALLHVLRTLAEDGALPELTAFLQCTSPLTAPADVDGTLRALVDRDADCAVAVAPFHGFLWQETDSGALAPVDHDATVRLRRQDRDPRLRETGAAYAFRTDGFRTHGHRFFGRVVGYEMPLDRVLEIDEPADLELADVALRRRQAATRARTLPPRIDAVAFDFDGVFTDNGVYLDASGAEHARCDRSDGHGIGLLRQHGLPMVIVTAEQVPIATARGDKLGVPVRQGVRDKLAALDDWLAQRGIDWDHSVVVGNDVADLEAMRRSGCGVAVADAHPQVRSAADLVLQRPGGHGAVRELCDLVLDRLADPGK